MSLRTLLGAGIAALVLSPAAAVAAPDHQGTVSAAEPEFKWASGEKTGAVYTSDVANRVPACSPVFSCDAALVKTEEYGNLALTVVGKGLQGQATLNDVDVHVYSSNENGAKGELLGEDTSADANEAVLLEDVPAGYYLVYTDWYLGAGSIDGTAKLEAPTTPADPENPPVFTPATDQYPDTEPAATYTFATPGDKKETWTAQGGGLSDATTNGAPCTAATCDYRLFKLDEAGLFTLTSTGDQPTVIDGDIILYESNADGGLGQSVGAATAFTPNETLSLELEPGYYLMRYQFSGAGTYTGTAQLAPLPVVED